MKYDGLKLMVSMAGLPFESRIAWRSEPAPESPLLLTVSVSGMPTVKVPRVPACT